MGVMISAAIYQPWRSTSFDIRDFSEFLPLLTHNPSTAARFRAFLSYYATQGRVNALTYVFIVLRWNLFGWEVALWQWARFAELWIVIVLVFALLRRLGSSTGGAAAGAALYLASFPAQGGWLRLTAGEPLGTIFLLAAAHLAVGYNAARRWRLAAAGITILICGALMVKEMFVAALPFVLLTAGGDHIKVSRWGSSQRLRWLSGLVLTTTILTLGPMAVIALQAGSDRYASLYGSAGFGLGRFLGELRILLLPVSSTAPSTLALAFFPNVLFLWVLTRGWAEGLSVLSVRADRLRLLLLATSLPVCAAVFYLPWPVFAAFYAFPYFLSSAILLAMALTFLGQHAPRQALTASIATLLILLVSSVLATREAARSYALHRTNADLAKVISRDSQLDTVFVATRSLPFQNWQGSAATLIRYAVAIDSSSKAPPGIDIECDKAAQRVNAGGGPTLLISYADDCGALRRPVRSFVQRFRYPAWPFFELRNDSIRADVITRR